jgi:8-oxo-dGTP pyrophosphatase MutT (NUDIX family)
MSASQESVVRRAVPPTGWSDVRLALEGHVPRQIKDVVSSRAAVALVLRDGAAGLELLFIRRAEQDGDPWSGQMAFPGGRAEPGEDALRATATRETHEEIGIDLTVSGELLGTLDEVRAMARMRPMDLTIQPFVFRLREPAELALSTEVSCVHWLPLDELLGDRWLSTMEYTWQGTTLRFPCLRYEDLVIWGLTFRMFTGFRDLLARGDEKAADPGSQAGATAR